MNASATLAELAVTHPAAAAVFHRHRLDFCCGGRRSLADVCLERGLDPEAILNAISEEGPRDPDARRWDEEPLPNLVDHIVTRYHDRLRQSLPDLVRMAARVEARHGDKAECPLGLAAHLERMQADLLDHLQKEEQILFPMIVRGQGARAPGPVHVLEVEHEHHRTHLVHLRALTADLTLPESACTTWRALYLGLEQLEQELMEHIHLENNVLFPRALAG
jgi:regulator of cell morphogenesis and NO signaling